MKSGGVGGAHTVRKGSEFEIKTDNVLLEELRNLGYLEIEKYELSGKKGPLHGRKLQKGQNELEIYYKSGIYKLFFEPRGIDYKKHFSARLEPDTAIFSSSSNTLTIIEKKQMTSPGSVAEKLQTCDYKRFYYETLLSSLNVNLAITWLLGDYFLKQEKQLNSVYEYMLSKGSTYYFGHLPVSALTI